MLKMTTELCCLEVNGAGGSVEKGLTEHTKKLVAEWLSLDQVAVALLVSQPCPRTCMTCVCNCMAALLCI